MSGHPASYALEGHAAGDHDAEVAAHMAACEACRAYVERSVAAAKAWSPAPALEKALAADARRRAGRRFAIALGLAPLAAAAAVFLLVQRPAPPHAVAPTATTHATQFKGGIQLAIVRDRGGEQERFADGVTVRPGDRLRVEIAIDRERPVTVGVLADDGAWLTLLAPALLEPGTHLSERAAQVDEHAAGGVVLAGDPEDVARARATRDFASVTALAVRAEP